VDGPDKVEVERKVYSQVDDFLDTIRDVVDLPKSEFPLSILKYLYSYEELTDIGLTCKAVGIQIDPTKKLMIRIKEKTDHLRILAFFLSDMMTASRLRII
jgi:hypothetical protein